MEERVALPEHAEFMVFFGPVVCDRGTSRHQRFYRFSAASFCGESSFLMVHRVRILLDSDHAARIALDVTAR